MSVKQQIITIVICMLGTMATRFLPFLIFKEKKDIPDFINYIGNFLPSAVFAMLLIYCLKNVDFLHGTHGISEIIAIIVTALIHIWKRQMLFSIAAGTVCYMLLIHYIA